MNIINIEKKNHLIYQGTHVLSNEYFLTFSSKKEEVMSIISMSLCMLTNMSIKFLSFFKITYVNHEVNPKKKTYI